MDDTARYTPRYPDRAVDDEAWIRSFLRRRPVGVLGTVADGEPFLVPLLFAYDPDEHAVFVHLSPAGRTVANVRGDGRATFAVFEYGRLLPATEPKAFDIEYESVVVHGTASLVVDPARARAALEALMAKFAPHLTRGEDYEAMTDSAVEGTAVLRLDVEHWSGKRNSAADGTAAYSFDEVRSATRPE